MTKSADAFRTISEVSEDLDIPQHVLRFWETRFTSIRPLKRGGGRRYYRPDDVELLKGIRTLLYGQGYTIKGVQRILKDSGPRFVQGVGRGDPVAAPARRAPGEPWAESDEEMDEPDANAAASFGDGGVPAPAGPAPDMPAFASDVRSGLSAADRDRLHAALDELLECRRILGRLRES